MKHKRKKSLKWSTNPDPAEPDDRMSETPDRGDQEIILGLIASLHLNSDYSDLTLICEEKIIPAHKLIVCPRSQYFHRACYGGFKETGNTIRLDGRDPILVEKMLEFLYTANYTLPCGTRKSGTPQAACGETPEMVAEPAIEPMMDAPLEKGFFDEAAANIAPAAETATPAQENIAEREPNRARTNEKAGAVDESSSNYTTEQEASVEPLVDSLVNHHPSWFHARMYGEADYFMISDLKSKAEVHFRASLMSCHERESFAETIQEIYSTRANYQRLRQVAIETIVHDLPNFRKGSTPAIDSELMKSIPDFTYELCQATLDKKVGDPSNMEEDKSDVDFHHGNPSKKSQFAF